MVDVVDEEGRSCIVVTLLGSMETIDSEFEFILESDDCVGNANEEVDEVGVAFFEVGWNKESEGLDIALREVSSFRCGEEDFRFLLGSCCESILECRRRVWSKSRGSCLDGNRCCLGDDSMDDDMVTDNADIATVRIRGDMR